MLLPLAGKSLKLDGHLLRVGVPHFAALDPARLPGGLYNLASGSPMTVLELARRIQDAYARMSGTRVDLEVPPGGPGPVPPTTYSVSKLTALGLAPHRPVQSAIEETLAFCLANRERLAR